MKGVAYQYFALSTETGERVNFHPKLYCLIGSSLNLLSSFPTVYFHLLPIWLGVLIRKLHS